MSISEAAGLAPRALRMGALPVAIAAYAVAAWIVAPDKFPGVLEGYGQQLAVLPPILLIGLCAAALFRRQGSPTDFLLAVLRARGPQLVAVIACFWIGISAFTTFKIEIPTLVPFYADPLFANIDAALHGGEPALALHALLPVWAAWPLAYLYGIVWFIAWFGFVGYVGLSGDGRLRERYFWSMALILVGIGTVLATALSSVGPIFYDRIYHAARFSELDRVFTGTPVGDYMHEATGYLYANYLGNGHDLGTGISAMPSVHVAIVTLNALMLSSRGRRVGIAGWVFAGLIMFESVYLGWHYAIDGYLSFVLVCGIWWGVGRLQRGRAAATP